MSREKMTITWTRENPDTGEEEDIELPGKYEVCDRCQGTGTHVNPNIDGHGITADEWNGPDWSEEDKETYLSGGYDVICHECKGKRVVLEIDEETCDKQLLEEYYEHQAQVAQWDREDRLTRYYESGGYSDY